MFGNPETTTGGNALKFYSSVRLDVRRIGAIKNGDEIVGNRTAVKVVKNKMAPPFQKIEFDLMYGKGISQAGELLDLCVKKDLVEKSGAWYSYNGERMGQGRDNAKQFLMDNPELFEKLRKQILVDYAIVPDDSAPAKEAPAAGEDAKSASSAEPKEALKKATKSKKKASAKH
ncbi:MAG: hypothetical protein CL677_10030 [Bdellovibrionaceae bacterium]|nr:hypothetical protein [Pseudobdellovibrionaceae bacterium]